MKLAIIGAVVTVISLSGLGLHAQINNGDSEPRVELGAVDWSRDLEAAKRQSAETGKPIFVLFQEVPG